MADNNGSLTIRGLARRMIRVEKTLYDAEGGLVEEIRGMRRRVDALYWVALGTLAAVALGVLAVVLKAFGL